MGQTGGVQLPYELLKICIDMAVPAPPRARTRFLANTSTVCRNWRTPARDLLYNAPALPARVVWLLSRSLRHDRSLPPLVRHLDVYSVSQEPLLCSLLRAVPHLKSARIRVLKASISGDKCNWDQVLTILEQKNLERLWWIGGFPKELSRVFAWPLTLLEVHELDFYSVETLLRRVEPSKVLEDDALRQPSNNTLRTLTLSQAHFPFAFFDRLHPYLTNLTSFSLHCSILYSSDIDRCLSLIGPSLIHLSLLGQPSSGRSLFARSFTHLTSLVNLTLSGQLVDPAAFTSLPSSTICLTIVPGQLHPRALLLALLRRKQGFGIIGSLSLEIIRIKFVDWMGRPESALKRVWEEALDDLKDSASCRGSIGKINSIELELT
ncbi:hypothetical protein T439DRAFT_382387 [Meredithblackwellia eburnea MCA 4105]